MGHQFLMTRGRRGRFTVGQTVDPATAAAREDYAKAHGFSSYAEMEKATKGMTAADVLPLDEPPPQRTVSPPTPGTYGDTSTAARTGTQPPTTGTSNLGWWLLGGSVVGIGLLALLFGRKKRTSSSRYRNPGKKRKRNPRRRR